MSNTNHNQLQAAANKTNTKSSKLYGFLLGVATITTTLTCVSWFIPNIFKLISSQQLAIATALLAILSLAVAQFIRNPDDV